MVSDQTGRNTVGVGLEMFGKWACKDEPNAGSRSGIAEVKQENEILRTASSFFRREACPTNSRMIRYVGSYRDHFVARLIRRVLGNLGGRFMTSRGNRAFGRLHISNRAVRDQVLGN